MITTWCHSLCLRAIKKCASLLSLLPPSQSRSLSFPLSSLSLPLSLPPSLPISLPPLSSYCMYVHAFTHLLHYTLLDPTSDSCSPIIVKARLLALAASVARMSSATKPPPRPPAHPRPRLRLLACAGDDLPAAAGRVRRCVVSTFNDVGAAVVRGVVLGVGACVGLDAVDIHVHAVWDALGGSGPGGEERQWKFGELGGAWM